MLDQILAARTPSVVQALGGFIHLMDKPAHLPHDPEGRYMYRGYAIIGQDDGWGVWDPTRPDALDEDGWGATMRDACEVVDEIIDL